MSISGRNDAPARLFRHLPRGLAPRFDFDTARADVESYVMDRSELDIWSAEFFRQMVRMIKFA